MEFVETKRGGLSLILNGHRYRKDYNRGENIYWKCTVDNCRVRCKTRDTEELTKVPGDHSHPASHAQMEAKMLVAGVKRKCTEEPDSSVKQLYNSVLREMNTRDNADEIAGFFPQYHQVKSSLYRERRKFLPVLPQTRSEVDIQPPFSETVDGRCFLLASDGHADKILVFGTEENVNRMCASDKLFMDGTFWTTPILFTQLYTIHVMQYDAMTPVIYALLPDKKRETYRRLFDILKRAAVRIGLAFDPPRCSVDFELACIQAISVEFPNAVIDGCLFHFTQSIWRKTQEVGLANDYGDNPQIRSFIRRLAGLSFVPLDRQDEAWLLIAGDAPDDARIVQLTDYFIRTWFDDVAARFPHRMWNQFDRMTWGSSRTNNHVEGFHSSMNRRSEGAHPNIFKLCKLIREQQEQSEGLPRLRRAGQPLRRKAPRFLTTSRRLQQLHEEMASGQRDLVEFVDACSTAIAIG